MKKRIVSFLLALVMAVSLLPVSAFAANGAYTVAEDTTAQQGEDNSKVTVYFSLSDNGKYKTGTSGKTLAYVPVTVEYFDLDDYGLGKYTRADAGEQPTVLHLFIKMLEQEYLNSGKLTVGGDALTVSGGAGSMYMTQFWGHDQNLTYYVNHVYPIMSGSTGATADWIILKDGDVVDVAMFDDWSFWGDAYAGFQYFMDGDAPTHSYTATAGEAKTITCKTAQTNMMSPSGTQYNVCGTQTVYYGKTLFAGDAQSVTTDSNGAASITFPEAGDWYVWVNGAKGKSTSNVVSSPAYAAVTVEAGGVTTPKLTLAMKKKTAMVYCSTGLEAYDESGERATCLWEVDKAHRKSVYAPNSPWNGTPDGEGNYPGKYNMYFTSDAPQTNVTITATLVSDPTVKASVTFDIVPMAEIYAVVNGEKAQKLEIEQFKDAAGKSYGEGIVIPAYVEQVMIRPAGEYLVADALDPNKSVWKAEYDESGYCLVNSLVGDINVTGLPVEKLGLKRGLLKLYPEDRWQIGRVALKEQLEVQNSDGKIYLIWEKGGAAINDVKAENAAIFTPYDVAGNSFQLVMEHNAKTASFLFKLDSAKSAAIYDDQFKVKVKDIEQKDGYFVLLIRAEDMEASASGPAKKTYYVAIENEDGLTTKILVTVYQRFENLNTPTAVEEYLCLASQYTNNTNNVTGFYGIRPERTLLGWPQRGTGELISIGNFGGYITYRFDDVIKNDPSNPYGIDFVVRGNSWDGTAGFSEPGNVLVSKDGSTWYTLAGSDHYSNNAYWDYTMTYTKSDKSASTYGGGIGFAAEWTDNHGNSGVSYVYPDKSDYPLFRWTDALEKSMTVSGTLLVSKSSDLSNREAAFPNWGYVDTGYNGLNPYVGGQAGEVFDLDWAVDENGQPVKLDWVKYVKVQTASNVDGGSIGEKSTEVSAIYKTDAAAAPVGVTAAPASISINGQKLALKDGVDVYSAVADTAVEVAVDAPEGANVYINDVYGKSAKFDSLNHRMVRVVVQEGEKKPVIYYVNLKTQAQADEDAVADVIAKINAIGVVSRAAKSRIDAARKAYDGLTDAQKALVPASVLKTLTDAETAYANLPRSSGSSGSGSSIYPVQNGSNAAGGTDYSGGKYGLIFRASVSGVKGVQVDGKTIGKANYTVEGSYPAEVYLKAAYLKRLANGKHTLTVLYDGGSLTTEFTIGGVSTSPTTGDAGMAIYAAMSLLSLTGGALVIGRRRKES